VGAPEPAATPDEVAAVLYGLRHWDVERVVIIGPSRDPTYASGFFTAVVGSLPAFVDGAWVWRVPRGRPTTPPVLGAQLPACRAAAAAPANARHPLFMARCVLFTTGRAA
jgi:hypothetical protein